MKNSTTYILIAIILLSCTFLVFSAVSLSGNSILSNIDSRLAHDSNLWENIQKIEETHKNNLDEAWLLASKTQREFINTKDKKGLAKLNYWLGRILLNLKMEGDQSYVAQTYLQKSAFLWKESGDTYELALVHQFLGNAYAFQGKNDSAYFYLQKSLQTALNASTIEPKYQRLEADAYKNIAAFCINLVNPEDSLDLIDIENLQEAKRLNEKARSLYADLYIKWGDKEDLEGEMIVLRNISLGFIKAGDYDQAIKFASMAFQVGKENFDRVAARSASYALGEIYQNKYYELEDDFDFKESKKYYHDVLKDTEDSYAEIYHKLGFLYNLAYFFAEEESSWEKNMLDSSRYYYELGLAKALEEEKLEILTTILGLYEDLCEELGNCPEVIERARIAYPKLLSNNQKRIADNQKEFEKFRLEYIKEEARIKYYFLAIAFIFLFIIASLIFLLIYQNLNFKRREEVKDNELKISRLERENQESAMQVLRLQLDPHFIANSLNAIEYLIKDNENKRAAAYLRKFAKLNRFNFNHARKKFIPLSEEIDALKKYIEIEQLRLDNKFEYHFSLDQKINAKQVCIPPMLFQPFVENAITHGIKPKYGKGKLNIQFLSDGGDILYCSIEDDGVGRNPEKNDSLDDEEHSTAVNRERIESMNKNGGYGSLNIKDLTSSDGSPIGTKVEIFLSLKHMNPLDESDNR